MSKWIDKEKFAGFKKNKEQERESQEQQQNQGNFRKWNNPKMGSVEKAKEYVLRFLTDPQGEFYKKYFYHMFRTGEKWNFIGCPKTHDMEAYCPWCHITQILWQGNDADKKKAKEYGRKERYVGNVFIKKDPRDADTKDEWKVEGTTRLYEFPATVEKKINTEVTDDENGYGIDIFDPEDGYNFLLRIAAKKPDANGKVWPDYEQAMFARKATSIGTKKEVKEIMESRQNLDEYLESLLWTTDDMKNLLKSEMVWDDIKDDFEKYVLGVVPSSESDETDESSTGDDVPDYEVPKDDENHEKVDEDEEKSDEDVDDEDLLNELRGMG